MVAQYVQAGLAVASLATGLSARSAAKRARRAAFRVQALQRFNERLQARRSFRQQEAEAVARAGNTQSLGDSSFVGGLGAFTSQANANVGFVNQIDRLQDTIATNTQKVQQRMDMAGLLGQGAQLAGMFSGGAAQPKVNTGTPASTTANPIGANQPVQFGPQTFAEPYTFNAPTGAPIPISG